MLSLPVTLPSDLCQNRSHCYYYSMCLLLLSKSSSAKVDTQPNLANRQNRLAVVRKVFLNKASKLVIKDHHDEGFEMAVRIGGSSGEMGF